MSDSHAFYRQLNAIEHFVDVADLSLYTQVPDDWSVIITDVQGSTRAIEAGRYKDVNSLGVASIVAVRNALPGVDIPFVFGGDGATLLCPTALLPGVEVALRGLQDLATSAFELGMRAGIVSVGELREGGHPLLVARFRASEHVALAMFAGGALAEAERLVKHPELGARYAVSSDGPRTADFTGFECRWQPVPNRAGQFVSLLVQAASSDPEEAARVYLSTIQLVDEVLGVGARPVHHAGLHLASGPKAFEQEARLVSGKRAGVGLYLTRLKIRVMAWLGRTLMRTGRELAGFDGSKYVDEVVANTDYRKFDDTLRMVLDASPAALAALRERLSAEHRAGRLCFGIHTSDTALMTCVIDGYDGNHVHFVDGADGGYALAAKELKGQLKAR
ncbi:MAG: DUF3095 domain-containing protein [Sandaracinaceae bacterium]|jgi:hypothetical protein|nr:DUF3095 domain-containing protein [Sandaracinaceae bacterium]MBK7778722.1 DUF3095 domain-containing protein [Sandaracinaceae bacterium]MBK8406668.1 DUF3095 domain-containing protein [Sandaracinaceae bacterium]MBK8589923.1 DUF3095 domain-containing protein [Sandaracinaceae bacterium]MBP7684560.1 DUF3095 domain-containing protein [Deltaproteobacteria bacterium]